MAGKQSAGLLLYRRHQGVWQVFLVHPGGPFWKAKDLGAWSIPKGEFAAGEDPLEAAKREFREETGLVIERDAIALTPIKQTGGKLIHAWAMEGDCDPGAIRSNTFSIEWPPRSGRMRQFPEVDRGEWFGLDAAQERLTKAQRGFIDQLRARLPPENPPDDRRA